MYNGKPSKNFCNAACPSGSGIHNGWEPQYYQTIDGKDVTYEVILNGESFYTNERSYIFFPTSHEISFQLNYLFTCDCTQGSDRDKTYEFSYGGTTIYSDIVLPITLGSFEAFVDDDNNTHVEWTTLSETNCSHFIVEVTDYVSENTIWHRVDSIPSQAKNGNSTEMLEYSCVDNYNWSYMPEVTYYRILQYDLDGTYNVVSEIVDAEHSVNAVRAESVIFPNPCYDSFNINTNVTTDVYVYDVNGVLVDVFNNVTPGTHNYTVNYAQGVYFVKVGDKTHRVIKL